MKCSWSRRQIAACSVAAALAAISVAGVTVRTKADGAWSAMAGRAEALRGAWEQRDLRRAPAWGDAARGSAFARYERAEHLAGELLVQDAKALAAAMARSDAEIAEETLGLRWRWQPVLEELRAGAHCEDARPRQDLRSGFAQAPVLLECRAVTNMAVFQARALRHMGRHREAVQWLLDAGTYAVDHMQGPSLVAQMIGLSLLSIVTAQALPAPSSSADAAALELLASGLAQLDARVPPCLPMDGELALMAYTLGKATETTAAAGFELGAWRHGFSSRWRVADLFARTAAASGEMLAHPELPWPQRQRRMAEVVAQASADDLEWLPNLQAAEFNWRTALTELRLLRVAVDVLRGRVPAALRDPLGNGPLTIESVAAGTRIASAGRRGDAPIERVVAPR